MKIFKIETPHVFDFDDIASFKIHFALVSGVSFEGISLVPIWKTIWLGLSLQNTWSVIYLTVAPWEGRTNTLEFWVLREMSYPLTFFFCLTMLSQAIYPRLALDGFRAFSLFISFLLTYRIGLELLKLLVYSGDSY